MNLEPDFRADLQARQPHEHVERLGDAAVGRILERNHAEVDMAAIDLFEHRRDAADPHELDSLSEAFDGGEVAVTVFGAEVGNSLMTF